MKLQCVCCVRKSHAHKKRISLLGARVEKGRLTALTNFLFGAAESCVLVAASLTKLNKLLFIQVVIISILQHYLGF